MLTNKITSLKVETIKPKKVTSHLYCFFSHNQLTQKEKAKVILADEYRASIQKRKPKKSANTVNNTPEVLPMYTDMTTINLLTKDLPLAFQTKHSFAVSHIFDKFLAIFRNKK